MSPKEGADNQQNGYDIAADTLGVLIDLLLKIRFCFYYLFF